MSQTFLNKPLRTLANFVSALYHPVFIPFLMVYSLTRIAPNLFLNVPPKELKSWLFNVALNTVFFPLIMVLLMRALGFLKSIKMHDAQDRLIPLMGSMIFYFWCYHVFNHISAVPPLFKAIILAIFWCNMLLFIISIFAKISMHATAMGSTFAAALILHKIHPTNTLLPLAFVAVSAVLVAWARLFLKEHTKAEVYLGTLVGFLAQVGAYFFIK